MDNEDFKSVVAGEPVVEAAPVAEEVEEQDELGELYDHVIPDVSGGLSVEVLNLAYQKLWDIEFEKWVLHAAISTIQVNYNNMKARLNLEETKALLSGENTGSNPEKRAAWNQERFAKVYGELDSLQRGMIEKQIEMAEAEMVWTICKQNITRLETILKLAETSTMISYMNPQNTTSAAPQPAAQTTPVILVPGAQNQKH